MKTQDEIKTLRTEVETLSKKLAELSEEELVQVVGGDVTSANIVGYCIGGICGRNDDTIENVDNNGPVIGATVNKWKTHNGIDIE